MRISDWSSDVCSSDLSFGDGRGYSVARILREAGYTGELRAVGDVLVDQLFYMRRCGFDSFAPNAPLDANVVEASLQRYSLVYQKAADGRQPVWALRHGCGSTRSEERSVGKGGVSQGRSRREAYH